MDNIIAYIVDAFSQYLKWCKVAKRTLEVSRPCQVEIEGMKLIESQNEQIVTTLKLDLEMSKKK